MKHCANKNCSQQNPQPLDCYHNNRREPDGLSRYCKTCQTMADKRSKQQIKLWGIRGREIARQRKQGTRTGK